MEEAAQPVVPGRGAAAAVEEEMGRDSGLWSHPFLRVGAEIPSASSFLSEGAAGLECPSSPCGTLHVLGAALALIVDAQRV